MYHLRNPLLGGEGDVQNASSGERPTDVLGPDVFRWFLVQPAQINPGAHVFLGPLLVGSKRDLGKPPSYVLDLYRVEGVWNPSFPLGVSDALQGNRSVT